MQNVRKERNKYIGGSDVPIIMGLVAYPTSVPNYPTKDRMALLHEKAGLVTFDEMVNNYTEYGNLMEPKIREYINETENTNYVENKTIDGDLRYHADGFNGKAVLEIKTTSGIYDNVNDYKKYLVQLLTGMKLNNVKAGVLAVYERPKDFSEELEPTRLHIYKIALKDYKDLMEEIEEALDSFRNDLEKVKENPFITEEELQPKELLELVSKHLEIATKLKPYEELKKEDENLKKLIAEIMESKKIKPFRLCNGGKVTLVEGTPDEQVETVDFEKLRTHKKIYSEVVTTKIKKGRKAYVKITEGKEN